MHPAVRELRKIDGERFFRRFDDWLDLMLAAFSRDEERYMATIGRYGLREPGKPHPADHFAHALGAIHAEMRKDNDLGVIRDHLGEIYETEGAAEREFAQFFTPMPLCELMARMTIDETAPEDARIADPACGSGRLLMACIRLRPRGRYFGVDKDPVCAKMAALNMLWRNVDSRILWGNSLTLKAHGGWMTASTALGGQIRAFGPEVAQLLLEGAVKAMQEPVAAVSAAAEAKEEAPAREQPTGPIVINTRGQFEMDL
jgi:hypothetical protein